MSFHHDFQEWERSSKPEGCPVCQNWPPPEDMVTIAGFPASWLDAHPRVCLRGTCCLLLKPHAVELYDMADTDLVAFMREAQLCARALRPRGGASESASDEKEATLPPSNGERGNP